MREEPESEGHEPEGVDSQGADRFSGYVPREERPWRHPSELTPVDPTPGEAPRSGIRQSLTVAAFSALGGGLIVAGLWLTLGSVNEASVAPVSIERVAPAENPTSSISAASGAEGWSSAAAEVNAAGVAKVTVHTGIELRSVAAVGFDHTGLLLTSAVGLEGADSLTVTLLDGRELVATVVGTDPTTDIAVIRVDEKIPIAALAPDFVAVRDDAVVVVGPDAQADETSVVAAATRIEHEGEMVHGLVQLAAPTGAPGAAVVTDTGAVIAVVTGLGEEADGLLATPIAVARRVAESIATGGPVDHPWLGIEGTDHSDDDGVSAALVTWVEADGPARRSGLRMDDLVVGVGGTGVESMDELIAQLRRYEPGDEIRVDYIRDGEPRWCRVVLGALDT